MDDVDKYWECHYCKWRLTDVEHQAAWFDFKCPRCGTHISDFHCREVKTER